MERELDPSSLKSTCIPDVFRDCTWAPLLIGSVDVHHVLVQEFFLNVIVEGDHLNCWVRGKEFTLLALSSLPYDKRKSLVVLAIAQVLGGDWYKKCLLITNFSPEMRTLAYIMMFNLFPVKNLMNLSHPRDLFLRDLYLKDIDICAHIYHLLAKCVSKRTSWMTLPFPGLIMSIMCHERV